MLKSFQLCGTVGDPADISDCIGEFDYTINLQSEEEVLNIFA